MDRAMPYTLALSSGRSRWKRYSWPSLREKAVRYRPCAGQPVEMLIEDPKCRLKIKNAI